MRGLKHIIVENWSTLYDECQNELDKEQVATEIRHCASGLDVKISFKESSTSVSRMASRRFRGAYYGHDDRYGHDYDSESDIDSKSVKASGPILT